MKKTFFVLFALINSTIAAQTAKPAERIIEQQKKGTAIVKDIDANGIDDTKENQQSGKKQGVKMRDKFIDANGDGICDNREQGLGFRRGKVQTTNQTGKRQLGRQK